MINNVKDSINKARSCISSELERKGKLNCTFIHGKHEIKGEILYLIGNTNNPCVKIRSHTGSERSVLISSLVDIDDICEI